MRFGLERLAENQFSSGASLFWNPHERDAKKVVERNPNKLKLTTLYLLC